MVCLGCGQLSDRYEFQEQLKQLNPDAAAAVAHMVKAGADKVPPTLWQAAPCLKRGCLTASVSLAAHHPVACGWQWSPVTA